MTEVIRINPAPHSEDPGMFSVKSLNRQLTGRPISTGGQGYSVRTDRPAVDLYNPAFGKIGIAKKWSA
jgi:hypothetical protein